MPEPAPAYARLAVEAMGRCLAMGPDDKAACGQVGRIIAEHTADPADLERADRINGQLLRDLHFLREHAAYIQRDLQQIIDEKCKSLDERWEANLALTKQRDALMLAVEEAYAEGWDAGLVRNGRSPLGCYRPDWVTSTSKEALRRTASREAAIAAAEPEGD